MLALLKLAPGILGAVGSIVEAITGKPAPAAAGTPEGMAEHIAGLPPEQQAEIQARTLEALEAMDRETTARWSARMDMETASPVEKLRATARPQIALSAMRVIAAFRIVIYFGLVALTAEWLARIGFEIWGCRVSTGPDGTVLELCKTFPRELSFPVMIAGFEPVIHMIWPSVIAALTACVSVITAYMGARERDKARADEMAFGRPLESSAATVAAAGGLLARLIRSVRGQ